jgi:hypothetical protein
MSPRSDSASWISNLIHFASNPLRSFLVIVLALVVPICGCGSSGSGGTATPPIATPTVTLSSSLSAATVGQPLILTWLSSGASSCSASGAWSGTEPVSGSTNVMPGVSGTLIYSLSCSGAGGSVAASAQVAVSPPAFPVANSFSPNTLTISTSEGAPYGNCHFWTQTASQCNVQTGFGYGPTRVMRMYICLTGEVNENDCSTQPPMTGPISAQMLSDMATRLAAFQGTGMRVLPRFTYNFGPAGPNAQDAPLSVILNNIDQVAPILLQNKDLIFALEVGFIGTWGEWHDSTNGNDTAAAHAAVLNKELSYFSGIFPLVERYPGDLIQYEGGFTPPVGIGLHDDYYASEANEGATWNSCDPGAGYCLSGVTPAQLQSYAAAVSASTMFVGEFGTTYPALQNCASLDAYSHTYNVQSIVLTQDTDLIGELRSEGCALNFYNKVGTRIELRNATVSGTPAANGQLTLAMTLVNTGYGRVIRKRPATILLLSAGTVIAKYPLALSAMDLTKLAPSANPIPLTFQTTLTLPASLPSGQIISVVLFMPDAAPSLTSQPAYALPLSSTDSYGNAIFSPSTGYNLLALLQSQ